MEHNDFFPFSWEMLQNIAIIKLQAHRPIIYRIKLTKFQLPPLSMFPYIKVSEAISQISTACWHLKWTSKAWMHAEILSVRNFGIKLNTHQVHGFWLGSWMVFQYGLKPKITSVQIWVQNGLPERIKSATCRVSCTQVQGTMCMGHTEYFQSI